MTLLVALVRQCTRPAAADLDVERRPQGFKVDYELVNPRRPLGLRPPSISGNLTIEVDGRPPRLRVAGRADGFPSIEIYQDMAGPAPGTRCLYRQEEETVFSLFGPRGEKEVRTGKGC